MTPATLSATEVLRLLAEIVTRLDRIESMLKTLGLCAEKDSGDGDGTTVKRVG